jgi:hypothetical protein
MFDKPLDVLTPVGIKTIRSERVARDTGDRVLSMYD